MRARAVSVLMAMVLVLTSCQPRRDPRVDEPPSGASEHVLTVGGRERTFTLYVPPSLPQGVPSPLVVMLHGGFGTGSQAREAYGWDAEADRSGFVVAYPDGLHRAWAVGGGCCGRPGAEGVDDVAFVEAVVAAVGGKVALDPARVYATGISNGAMLAYRLACDSALFAAIGPVAGTRLGGCDRPRTTSVIHVHGDADRSVTLDGSPGTGRARIDGPPVEEVVAGWRAVNDCAAPVVTTEDAVTRSVASCRGGRAVELVVVAGAGHQWPGSQPKPVLEQVLGLDPPSRALDATAAVWRFFADHPRRPD